MFVKAREVLDVLGISRPTLTKYVKTGLINVVIKPSGRYEYNDVDVFKLLNKGEERRTYLYARVSSKKQKNELENQIEKLKQFCLSRGYSINQIFTDIESSISFNKRKNFFEMFDDILAGKVERVIVPYRDSISRIGYELFYRLFKEHYCSLIVVDEADFEKLGDKEKLEEVIDILFSYGLELNYRDIQMLKEILNIKG